METDPIYFLVIGVVFVIIVMSCISSSIGLWFAYKKYNPDDTNENVYQSYLIITTSDGETQTYKYSGTEDVLYIGKVIDVDKIQFSLKGGPDTTGFTHKLFVKGDKHSKLEWDVIHKFIGPIKDRTISIVDIKTNNDF